jgi:hypothetical protein
MMLFLVEFVDLAEPVHVQLSDERFDLPVPEIHRQHLVFKSLGVLDVNLAVVLTPAYDVFELVFLNKRLPYIEDAVDLHYELWNGGLRGGKLNDLVFHHD